MISKQYEKVNQKSLSYMNTISIENVYEYLDKDSNLKRLQMGDAAHF